MGEQRYAEVQKSWRAPYFKYDSAHFTLGYSTNPSALNGLFAKISTVPCFPPFLIKLKFWLRRAHPAGRPASPAATDGSAPASGRKRPVSVSISPVEHTQRTACQSFPWFLICASSSGGVPAVFRVPSPEALRCGGAGQPPPAASRAGLPRRPPPRSGGRACSPGPAQRGEEAIQSPAHRRRTLFLRRRGCPAACHGRAASLSRVRGRLSG